jgi:hypothetical protein
MHMRSSRSVGNALWHGAARAVARVSAVPPVIRQADATAPRCDRSRNVHEGRLKILRELAGSSGGDVIGG